MIRFYIILSCSISKIHFYMIIGSGISKNTNLFYNRLQPGPKSRKRKRRKGREEGKKNMKKRLNRKRKELVDLKQTDKG